MPMMHSVLALAAAFLATSAYACDTCEALAARTGVQEELRIELNASTVAWGYFWKYRTPQAYVVSGETFTIEMGSHLAGDAYDWMVKGDPGMEAIFRHDNNTEAGMPVQTRGRSGRTDGGHLMTGPVYICGAEPGDTLKIEILDMKPRVNPNTGKAYASNGLAPWGWQNRVETGRVDSTFIYELILDEEGYVMYAEPALYFRWSDADGVPLVKVPCPPTNGTIYGINGTSFSWSNPNSTFGGRSFECVNGTMTFGGYRYAGAIVQHPIGTEDYSVKGKWRLPVSPHIGNLGLASDVEATTNSAWPMRTGGNIDQKRLGTGASFYVPVEVQGGLLSAGDCHAGQTASEYAGTALETSFTARLRVTVIKAEDPRVSAIYKDLPTPLLENANEWCWQGYNANDYLHDNVTANGTVGSWNTLLPALTTNTYRLMNNTASVATDGLVKLGFTRDQAISILTFACDWEITQVVNTNMGNNICCSKYVLPCELHKGPYTPETFPGSSRPLKIKYNKIDTPYK